MPQSFACLPIHLVFSTKNRAPLIAPDLAPRLYEYVGGTLRAERLCLLAAGGIPDHVHLLVSFSRDMSVAEAIRLIKSNSSKWLHEMFPPLHDFAWQTGYAAFAVSYSQIERVKRYIAGQEEHHRKRAFQDELRLLLKKHHIEIDERYAWD